MDGITQAQPTTPHPKDFALTMESGYWMPVWITTPEVSRASSELIKLMFLPGTCIMHYVQDANVLRPILGCHSVHASAMLILTWTHSLLTLCYLKKSN